MMIYAHGVKCEYCSRCCLKNDIIDMKNWKLIACDDWEDSESSKQQRNENNPRDNEYQYGFLGWIDREKND